MLKFEGIAIGSKIKAYDFEPMPDRGECFIEGIITDAGIVGEGYKAYTIKVTREVFSGEEVELDEYSRLGEEVFVPMEVSMMEYDERVTVLEGAE